MRSTKFFMALAIATTIGFVSCKPSDADLKTKVEAAEKADQATAAVSVDVKEGVATLTGELKDTTAKSSAAKAAETVKGIKSVVNNCTVTPPPPAPVAAAPTTTIDAAAQQKVKDGLKDINGVTVEFVGDKAVLKGEVSKKDRMKIMQMMGSAKVKSDVTGLTDKK